MPNVLAKSRRAFFRGRVSHATARNDERSAGVGKCGDDFVDIFRRRFAATDNPVTFMEELGRIIKGFAFHILRERDRHSARIRRIGKDAHRFGKGSQELFRTRDPVEEAADRPEAVVDRPITFNRMLELLKNVAGAAVSKSIGCEEKDRDPVYCRSRRTRNHVGGTGADGRCAGKGGATVLGFCITHCCMDHRLLVLRLVIGQLMAILFDRLADRGDIAMPEYSENPAN